MATAAAAVAGLIVSGAVASVPHALAITPLDQMFRARSIVEQLGPFGYHAYDTWNYARSHAGFGARPRCRKWKTRRHGFASARRCARDGANFAAARGRNLIVVQVESLQDFAVDFTSAGRR